MYISGGLSCFFSHVHLYGASFFAKVQMGKKSWFSAMKKALSPSTSKTTKTKKRSNKSKANPKNSCHVNQARRAFRSLRVMRRPNLWLQGQAVKRQTTFALMRIQTMGRVQCQAQVMRIRMAEVNEALQRQLIQKRLKILEKIKGTSRRQLTKQKGVC